MSVNIERVIDSYRSRREKRRNTIDNLEFDDEEFEEKHPREPDGTFAENPTSETKLNESTVNIPEKIKEVKSLARNIVSKAKENDRIITSDVSDAAKSSGGNVNYDVGNGKKSLDYRIKSENSLEQKITKYSIEGTSMHDMESKIYDTLRYTCLCKNDSFLNTYSSFNDSMNKKGYEMVRCKNTFNDEDSSYRGLNCIFKSRNGYLFEVQFHTKESMEIKEKNHKLYERERVSTDENEKELLRRAMKENVKYMRNPFGSEKIISFEHI